MQKEHCNDLSFLNILTLKQNTFVYLWFWRISHEFVNSKLEVFLNQWKRVYFVENAIKWHNKQFFIYDCCQQKQNWK